MHTNNTFLWSRIYRCGSSMFKSTSNYFSVICCILTVEVTRRMAGSICLRSVASWAKYFGYCRKVIQRVLSAVHTPQQAPPIPVTQTAKSNQIMQPLDRKHKFIIYKNRIQVVL